MILYAIRHKETKEFMPQLKRRGYTHWNPSRPDHKAHYVITSPIRLLETRKQADRCIIQWNALPNSELYHRFDDIDVRITNDGRKKEDLEVVKVRLRFER